jgi:excisionase family DNA binding protein
MPELKEVNSVEEIAAYLGFTPMFIYGLIAKKRLRASRPGRSYIITREAVYEMLAASENRKENDNAETR